MDQHGHTSQCRPFWSCEPCSSCMLPGRSLPSSAVHVHPDSLFGFNWDVLVHPALPFCSGGWPKEGIHSSSRTQNSTHNRRTCKSSKAIWRKTQNLTQNSAKLLLHPGNGRNMTGQQIKHEPFERMPPTSNIRKWNIQKGLLLSRNISSFKTPRLSILSVLVIFSELSARPKTL